MKSLLPDTARNLKAEFWFFLSHWSYKGCHLSTTITSSVHIFFVLHCSLPSSCDNTQPMGHCHVARIFRIFSTNSLYKWPALCLSQGEGLDTRGARVDFLVDWISGWVRKGHLCLSQGEGIQEWVEWEKQVFSLARCFYTFISFPESHNRAHKMGL